MGKIDIRKVIKLFKVEKFYFNENKISCMITKPFLEEDKKWIEKNVEFTFYLLNNEIKKDIREEYEEIKKIHSFMKIRNNDEEFEKRINELLTQYVKQNYFVEVTAYEEVDLELKKGLLHIGEYNGKLIKKDKVDKTRFNFDDEYVIEVKFNEFYKIQKELNEKIRNCRDVKYEQIKNKVHLALNVELMELCNETRCFNYWSKKQRSEDDVILEEFADVICFALTEWLENGMYENSYIQFFKPEISDNDGITKQFNLLLELTTKMKDEKTIIEFIKEFFKLGYMLGYNKDEILNAYKKKCVKNHGVQDNW